MRNKQLFKEFEKEPLFMRFLRGFCSDPAIYEEYSKNYRALFFSVKVAVENGEISEEKGRSILKECRDV